MFLVPSRKLTGIGGSTGTVPTLVQQVSSSANPAGLGINGDAYKLAIQPTLANNCLVLFLTYNHGLTPTITDNKSSSWPAATVSADAGVGAYVSAAFVLPGCTSGITTITVTFGSAFDPFQYDVYEYRNVATTSPGAGSHGTAGLVGPSLTCGAFTPTNNDATGGNLLLSYFALAGGASANPSSWVAGGSFTLESADKAWQNNQGFPHAAASFVQTASASINPGVTATGDSSDGYNCIAIALKAAAATGTAPAAGIHVDKVLHFTRVGGSSPLILQAPSRGNLRVLVTADNKNINFIITGVTDNESGTWTEITNPGGASPQMWYREGASANPLLTITVAYTGPVTASFRFCDISGAVTSLALDGSATTSDTTATDLTHMDNQPSGLTPGTAKGVVIACMGIGNGPGLAVTAPSGAIWGLCTYSGETDLDLMENADAFAIYYYSSTATLAFSWDITARSVADGGNSVFSTAAAFKSAA